MGMNTLLEIFFLPPMAVARLGSSPTPLDSFCWTETTSPRSPVDTVIKPAVSLKVEGDGSVTPYLPPFVVFKDEDGAVRPVAPFFELWAKLQSAEDGSTQEVPLTLALLAELNAKLQDIQYEIVGANRKAARRTSEAACGFMAREVVDGDDFERRELLAISPHTSGQEPLVSPDRPIPIGHFQVLRPVDGIVEIADGEPEVDRSILRVRFTPPKGIIYGPAEATFGPAPAVQPGQFEAPAAEYGRIHQIVAPEHRIVSSKTPWSTKYIMLNGTFEDPQPQDGYDGANVGDHRSWGCVDDISDSVITATMAFGGRRYQASARVFTSPPDFAPDRRPVFSLADDIADREELPLDLSPDSMDETKQEVLDLFQRAFETASLLNLDAVRARALMENKVRLALHNGDPGIDKPKAGPESMTAGDEPYVDMLPTLAPLKGPPSYFTKGGPNEQLPYTSALPFIHAPLQDHAVLMDLLGRRPDFIKRLVRPPFGKFSDLPKNPPDKANPDYRDPRVFRDQLHDMRMPPYMRDSALQPLSISHRQYRALIALIDYLQTCPDDDSDQSGETGENGHA
jgi:hypothetical protein